MVHKAGFGPAGLRFLAEDVFRLHHLCVWYAERDSNPQDPVPETGMSSFASPAHNVAPGKGFEPLTAGSEPTVLPLHYPDMQSLRGSNPHYRLERAVSWPFRRRDHISPEGLKVRRFWFGLLFRIGR